METTGVKVSKRGYIVLPASLRKEMDIKPGSRVLLRREKNQIILQPVSSFTDKLSGLTSGSFGKTPKDIDDFLDNERTDR